jgi:hypothetical protein
MSFATVNDVRLRRGFFEKHSKFDEVTTQFLLPSNGESIMSVTKNAVALTVTTEYVFLEPDVVNLIGAGQGGAGDHYTVRFGTIYDDAQIQSWLDQANGMIIGTLETQFPTDVALWVSTPPAPAEIIGLEADLAGCMAQKAHLQNQGNYPPEEMSAIRLEKKDLIKLLDDYRTGRQKVQGLENAVLVARGSNERPNMFDDLPNVSGLDFNEEDRRIDTRGAGWNTTR